MKTFVFRNQTVEPFFGYEDIAYSGYDDISDICPDADRYIWFYQVPVNADAVQLAREIDSYSGKLDLVLNGIGDTKPFVIFSLVNLFPLRLVGDDSAVNNAVNAFNIHAAQLAVDYQNVKWVDFSEFTLKYDEESLINWKYFLMSQTMLNPKLAHDFQIWWHRVDDELALARKKCLVLDLDNTLWGGVLGEDGVDGIMLGGDYPGKAYSYWQNALLQLQRNGVILALCSKNNESDVLELWEKSPSVVLKREHFSAMRINWRDKVANLQELSQELNIGLDSMVFIDDNPAERELVKQMLPEVAVPEFPEKPYQLMPFFKSLVERYFRIYKVTAEDREKTKQYHANALRRAELTRFADFDDYLSSLEIEVDVIHANEHNLPRIAQLTQKTNQFNLTTCRYTESDVQQRLQRGWHVLCMSVRDRFGDSGITGVLMMEPLNAETVNIDSLLVSCRILGKGIEEVFVKTALNMMRSQGYQRVVARYLPTSKNLLTVDFYDKMGMTCVDKGDDGSKGYEMELKDELNLKDYYKIRIL